MDETNFQRDLVLYGTLENARDFTFTPGDKITFNRYSPCFNAARPVTGKYTIRVNKLGGATYSAEFTCEGRKYRTRKCYTENSLVDAIIRDVIKHIY